ncbi:hypothetical protein [Streptomyces sp. TR02-1]|uniref:hypothetical protein n=1 Tax=Streptomyces sp. TR02-1 TaxID=3385977 RepID=UPI0039A0CA13
MPSPDFVLAPHETRLPPVHLPAPPGGRSLDAMLAAVQLLLEQHDHVVFLHSSSTDAGIPQRLRTVRSVLETDRIAVLRTELPPLATGVLAHQLRQLSVYDFGPGVLASAALLLPHYIYAGALLDSVAKLDRVAVSLRSHARSWVPGAQFGVLANPVPRLVDIDDRASLPGPSYPTHMVLAGDRISSDWVRRGPASQWPVQALEERRLPEESPLWWGTSKLVEFAAAIPDVGTLCQLVNSVQRQRCPWCALELIGERCVFCDAPVLPHGNPTSRPGVARRDGTPPGAGQR